MKQAVLISIQPKWCELIARGKKTVEVRKTIPKLEPPFTCYIYCTKGDLSYPVGNGMVCHNNGGQVVIGQFTCDWIDIIECSSDDHNYWSASSCLTPDDFIDYCNGQDLYAWHISNLKIYPKVKRLYEFCYLRNAYVKRPVGITKELFPVERPPQSWCYVREE